MQQRYENRRSHHPRGRMRVKLRVVALALAAAMLPILAGTETSQAGAAVHPHAAVVNSAKPSSETPYPQGRWDNKEPSHRAPTGPNALPGYSRVFVTDFRTWLKSSQWFLFRGVPGGDPAGLFEPSHVTIGSGVLKISTYQDPNYGNAWVSGGVGLYSVHPTYGAFFVRSRETAIGPDDVELLWPKDGQWPPEIDFDEMGPNPDSTTWTVHFDTPSDQVEGSKQINVLKWHTWGVVWTPTEITFIVDGYAYGTVTEPWEIPNLSMELDMQMESWCGISPDCPTVPSSMLIDWVTIYEPK
jgi:hypothetical protein